MYKIHTYLCILYIYIYVINIILVLTHKISITPNHFQLHRDKIKLYKKMPKYNDKVIELLGMTTNVLVYE